ncbi:flagellar basal body P-ring formation chaperone FlgA [Flaviflagellibacter deserti]|uniref:Flagellar basal body P-ring formation chaperone FlgA n=1 Tax=Flaviflagellibacter deserti TaxID=2267266 RepID=A0ABV9Z363_9HYPH
MNRTLALLGLVPLAIAFGHSAADAQTLRASAIVSAPIVTVGDLVFDAGAYAPMPIFQAPDPGQTGQVPAQAIVDAVRAQGLIVNPQGLSTVTVTRGSRRITEEAIAPLVQAEVAKRAQAADPASIQVSLDDTMKVVDLPSEADGPIALVDLTWRADGGMFDASIAISRRDGQIERRALRGTALETVPVVVLSQPVERGAPIEAHDLELVRKPKSEIRGDFVADMASVIGMELRRPVREGAALKSSDLAEPQVIKRGRPVTITLQSGPLTLTAVGEALRDAARGDSVQVMNPQSKRVLQAVATGPDQVTVTIARKLASNAR